MAASPTIVSPPAAVVGGCGGTAMRLLKALLTDLLMVENSDPIDLVNAELAVMSVTRTVSTPSMLPRMFVSLTVAPRPAPAILPVPTTPERLLVTV